MPASTAISRRDARVALLQFPYDFNVGNHMMWIAAINYLRRAECAVAYTAHGNNFDLDAMKRAVGDGVIIFIGGVTISRLWPKHPEVKRVVAAACPTIALSPCPRPCSLSMTTIGERRARFSATTATSS